MDPGYYGDMVAQFLLDDAPPPRRETDAERRARIQREAEIIAQGEAEIDAGLGIEDEDMAAWLDELDRDPDAPIPTPRGHSPAAR